MQFLQNVKMWLKTFKYIWYDEFWFFGVKFGAQMLKVNMYSMFCWEKNFVNFLKKEKNLIATFPYWFWLSTNILMFK